MQNLLLFIAKYHALLLFLFFEIVSFTLITQYNHYQRASIFSSINAVTSTVLNQANEVKQYVYLDEINDSLLAENQRLRGQMDLLKRNLKQRMILENENAFCEDTSLSVFLGDTTVLAYNYINAEVINNSTQKPNNYITINKGRKDGIRPEMGAISGNGVVGIVKDVSQNFATIIPILHKSMRVSVKMQRNNFIGSLRWEGWDARYAQLDDIPKHVRINIGDRVVTSGFSAFFPPDINIGTIEKWDFPEGSNFYDIKVKLSTPFSTLKYVYVVDYFRKSEQQKLEELSKDE